MVQWCVWCVGSKNDIMSKLTWSEKRTEHLSLTPLADIELGNLTIITGKNGVGKSHILDAINSGYFILENSGIIKKYSYLDFYKKNESSTNISEVYKKNVILSEIAQELVVKNIWEEICRLDEIVKQHYITANTDFPFYRGSTKEESTIITYIQQIYPNNCHIIINALADSKKYISDLLDADTTEFSLNLSPIDLDIQTNLSQLFINAQSTTSNDPPYNRLNKILQEINFKYRVSEPDAQSIVGADFVVTLCHNEQEIRPENLSSGEKIIFSFALSLFILETARPPDLLLFDEIDAFFDPEFTRMFLSILVKIITKYNIHVVLVTHSITTITLLNDISDSIDIKYFYKEEDTDLITTNQQTTINKLTQEIPTFDITYGKTKLIFVEAEDDRKMFKSIYQVLVEKNVLSSDIKLNFYPSNHLTRNGPENSDKVKENVSYYASKNIYGIIDWDLKNTSNENIIVFGEGIRYTMEQYLFDPLILALYLKRKELNFKDISNKDCQTLHDEVMKLLEFTGDYIPISYLNGFTINAKKQYLQYQDGHELFNKLQRKFDLNQDKKVVYEQFRKFIVKNIEFIPSDYVGLYTTLTKTEV